MTDDKSWQRVQTIFERIRAVPPEQRDALLNSSCDGNITIRAEVESLLSHHGRAGQAFLETPEAWQSVNLKAWNRWAETLIGTRVGHYTLRRLIASGGMGCVFEAQQEHPSRAVAVKILRPGCSAPSAWARFKVEPEILGRLRHPNIAQVFEAGVHGEGAAALPFFAMELIPKAQSLSEHVSVRQLQLNDRLELFAKVCDAVQHGHQKGIVHRDLKPGNILVGSDNEPKIIDFGVARATDADVLLTTQCTQAGDLIGTIRYMSPEQCDGDSARIDTRSDIYSLGVVLYELLTGIAPYDTSGTTPYAAIRVIKESPPRRPSEVNRALRGNLDAILLKALDKEPARRYATAAEFAQDIRRHLTHEPIEARPPGIWARVLHWGARHPAWITSAVCLVLATAILGSAFITRLVLRLPSRIQLSTDRKRADLLAASGDVMYSWYAEPPGSATRGAITFAEVIPCPTELGGGRLALLSFLRGTYDPNLSRSVCVFDLRSFSAPDLRWERHIEDGVNVPNGPGRQQVPSDFQSVSVMLVQDIFPAVPEKCGSAPEIVVRFQHYSGTQTIIRIYDITGELLYENWIDASLDRVVWSSGAGQLIFSGTDGSAYWSERGQLGLRSPHPKVVFALRPKLHEINRRLMTVPVDGYGETDFSHPDADWYLYMHPAIAFENIHDVGTLVDLPDRKSQGGVAKVEYFFIDKEQRNERVALAWDVDQHGRPVPNSLIPTNFFQAYQMHHPPGDAARLPEPEEFDLRPLPPIVAPAKPG